MVFLLFFHCFFKELDFKELFCRPLPRPPWILMENPWVPWGPMGSHGVPWKIQECRKSWILMKTTIRFDRKLECRGPNRCAIFFRSILSRQNPLNRHMEQNIFFGPKIQFFSFSATGVGKCPFLGNIITICPNGLGTVCGSVPNMFDKFPNK